jgi:hypothetical protein
LKTKYPPEFSGGYFWLKPNEFYYSLAINPDYALGYFYILKNAFSPMIKRVKKEFNIKNL